MKKLFALLLPLFLAVPAFATESTANGTAALPETNANGGNVMAIICLVVLVLGVIYLIVGMKKSK